jgi:lipopolysaccharide transport system ATP-binding protein
MSEPIITVENLGKKYIIGHQKQERYTALRDVIANSVKSLWSKKDQNNQEESEEFWALKDVSFEIKRGDRVGIIGRNGAGKSTLLKILSRITEPTEGRVSIKGRVASLLEVGTGFHPELTGRENIFLNGAILGMSREEIKRKFDEIVAFSEVEKFIDTPVKRYSSGMYVRLAFAVAAHLEPEILIVDEVLAVGDAQFQKKCLGKMEDVSAQEGRTVLFVSHNMGAINKLCNSSIWLNAGQIESIGLASNITEKYLSSSYQMTSSIEFAINTNKKAQILKARLINEEGIEQCELSCGQVVIAEIEFVINQKAQGCHLACIVTNQEGYHIFSTADTDSNPDLFQERLPGKYLAQVKLPTTSLNTGTYNIAIGLGIPGIEVFDRQEALAFTLHDTGDFGTLKEGSRRSGLLLVETDWHYV